MKLSTSICIFFALISFVFGQDDLSLKNVNRNIDISTQFARHTVSLTLENSGKSVSSFLYTIEANLANNLAYITAFDTQTGASLKVTKGEANENKKIKYVPFTVELGKALENGQSRDITVKSTFTHLLTPFPAAISQNEKQFVKYIDNTYFFSPYVVKAQTTIVKLASSNIESKTEKNPTAVKGDTITYGPYADIQSFSSHKLAVHFESKGPFLTIEKVVKELEISHWGNLAVEETFNILRHDGAQLKGAFSRYDYQRNPMGAHAVVQAIRGYLPSSASDIYYRDDIGNISTSVVGSHARGVQLDLVPRYPLFGGWKATFYYGYNLPLYQYLFNDNSDSSTFVLNTTFGVEFDDVVIDELVIRIILPEGAKDIDFAVPFGIDSSSTELHFTYLDTSGRPVLVITKRNVVSEHGAQYFQVVYRFSGIALFREPFLLVFAYFAFFLAVMVYARLSFKIGPTRQRSSNSEKLEDGVLAFKDLFEQRNELSASLDAALNKLWTNKNVSQYNSERRRIETSFASLKKDVQKVISDIESVHLEASRQAKELDKKSEKKWTSQLALHDLEVSYRNDKKFTKESYEKQKAEFDKVLNTLQTEIEDGLADLSDL